jgi:MFS family permease
LLLRLPRSLVEVSRSRTPFHIILKASYVRLERVLVFSIFFGLCFSCWNGFLAPTVKGLGAGAVSSFGTGYALGAVVTRLGLSHAIGTHRRRLIAISSLFAYGAGLVLIPHAYSGWHLLAIGTVCGMGHGIYYPSLSSLAAERFHPLYPGQGMSLYVSASGLGHFMGPPIWGALADHFGYGLIFLLAGLLLALATAVFVGAEGRGAHSSAD